MQNGYIERFNRSYRKEILNAYLFFNLAEVREHTQLEKPNSSCRKNGVLTVA